MYSQGFFNFTLRQEFFEPFRCSESISLPTPDMSPLADGRELKPAVKLKIVVEEDTKHLMKVENRLIPKRDCPPC